MNLSASEEIKTWYAIYTKPRAEKKVAQRIEDKNIEVFLPLVKKVRKWSDRKKIIYFPLIPSYVFVKINENNLLVVLPLDGVVRVLTHLGKPAKVKDLEIENLKILSNNEEGYDYKISDLSLVVGDAVEVIKGPFTGIIATCVKKGNKCRVVVKLNALGSCFNLSIPLNYLEKTKHFKK